MKIITASNSGAEIFVDDDDYPMLSRYTWYTTSHGYALSHIHGRQVLMHRFILNYTENKVIDHIDHNKLNNQKCNLRVVEKTKNSQNVIKKSAFGLRGVTFECGSFKASIRENGRKLHIGVFKNALDAALAYDAHAIRIYGPDALTNKKILKKLFDL